MKSDLLIKIQKKLELIQSFYDEIDNAKMDVWNDYETIRRDKTQPQEFSYRFQEILQSFLEISPKIPNIKKDIQEELLETCNHHIVEDDIECNAGGHIKYCVKCELTF